jgi:WD40 repeat protein/tRNA A-37 threonylcarbamoyl transferase component Bud32
MATEHDDSASQRADAILAAYIEAVEAGQAPDRQELLARHPELAAELAAFFADHDKVQQMAEPLRAEAEPLTQPPSETARPPGTVIRYFGDYELLEEIARGGMGVVYKARQVSLNRIVALKMILAGQLASPADVQRFRTEAENAANLDHPNIVPIYEVGDHEGQHYFSMKFVEGANLAQTISRRGAESPEKQNAPASSLRSLRLCVRLLETVARAVQNAHQRGILHRDLKPGNILLDAQGQPHVTDFGLAKRIEGGAGLTQSRAIVGTPSYMPPKQARAEKGLTTAADVYSLGAIFYELLTGRPPFQAETPLDTVLQVLSEEPVPLREVRPQIPADLETISLKCLQKEASKRYATAADLADDLGRFLAGEPIVARPVGRLERVSKWARRRPALAGLVAVSVVAVLALGGFGAYFMGTLAEGNQRLREQVERAEKAEKDAQQRATEAIAQRERAEWLVYLSQLNLAQREWQDNHVEVARNLLEKTQPNLRGWEYRYLDTLFNHLGQQTFRGYAGSVTSVCFSPDGTRLASSSRDPGTSGEVKVWDMIRGQELLSLKWPGTSVTSVCFSPDGKRLATATTDHTVKVCNVANGQEVLVLKGHTEGVTSVCFSPHGKRLASASGLQVKIWDAARDQEVFTLKGHTGLVVSVCFSPDCQHLATASWDRTVKVWDVRRGQEALTLKGHTFEVTSVAFSPDGKRLASAGMDRFSRGEVKVWDVEKGQEDLSLQGHTGVVYSVCFSPDGQRLATSEESTVRVWDAATGQEVLTFNGTGNGQCVCFSPDSKRLASACGDLHNRGKPGDVKIWDAATSQEVLSLKGHTDAVWSVCFSPDGKRLASASKDGTVKVWDASGGSDAEALVKGANP